MQWMDNHHNIIMSYSLLYMLQIKFISSFHIYRIPLLSSFLVSPRQLICSHSLSVETEGSQDDWHTNLETNRRPAHIHTLIIFVTHNVMHCDISTPDCKCTHDRILDDF